MSVYTGEVLRGTHELSQCSRVLVRTFSNLVSVFLGPRCSCEKDLIFVTFLLFFLPIKLFNAIMLWCFVNLLNACYNCGNC